MISRDFGATVLLDVTAAADDGTSVLRLLAENSDVETAYGGGFVKSIDGLASTYGTVGDAEAQDWFYWVDGIMADVGAGDYDLQGGQTAWWDYHAWSQAMYLPAAVFALPSPWAGQATPLHTNVEDAEVRSWAKSQGIVFSATEKLGEDPPASGVVVATAAEAEATPWLARRLAGEDGGVALVRLAGGRLRLRALDGSSGPAASGVCVALPNPDDGDAPLLLLLVTDRGPRATARGRPAGVRPRPCRRRPRRGTADAPSLAGRMTTVSPAATAEAAPRAARPRTVRRAALLRARERGRSGVRRLRPGVALSYTLALAAAALVTSNPVQAAAVLSLVIAALAASGVLRAARPYLRMTLYVTAIVLVVNPLFGAGGLGVLWSLQIGPLTLAITVEGIAFAVGNALRLAGVLLAFALLNLCVDPDDQLGVISRFSFRSGLVLSLASRLTPVFSRDAARISDAQKARGVRLDDGRRRDRAAARLPLLASLLTQSLERAVEVAASMEARGYGAGPRTRWTPCRPWRPADLAAAVATALAGGALVAGFAAGAWSFTYFPLLHDPLAALTDASWLLLLAGLSTPLLVTLPWSRARSSKG